MLLQPQEDGKRLAQSVEEAQEEVRVTRPSDSLPAG